MLQYKHVKQCKGHKMKEQLQAKIDEFVALLAQAQCEGTNILLDNEEDEAALEFRAEISTLREMIDYYVD